VIGDRQSIKPWTLFNLCPHDHSPEGDDGGNEMPIGGVTACGLFVARGNGPELLYFREEVFDQVPPLVGVFIVVALDCAVRLRWTRRSWKTSLDTAERLQLWRVESNKVKCKTLRRYASEEKVRLQSQGLCRRFWQASESVICRTWQLMFQRACPTTELSPNRNRSPLLIYALRRGLSNRPTRVILIACSGPSDAGVRCRAKPGWPRSRGPSRAARCCSR
jgi:hypothetical protein